MGLAIACRVQAPAGPPLANAVRLPVFDPAARADGRASELDPKAPLRVRDYGPEGVRRGERIRVRFNQPLVDAAGQAPTIELELWALPTGDAAGAGATGAAAPRRVAASSRSTHPDALELVPAAPLSPATTYEVVLPAGLRGRDGAPLAELRWRFETPRPELELLLPDEPLPSDEPLYVITDQPVRPEALSEHLRVHVPRAPGGEATPLPVQVRAVDWQAWPHVWRYEDSLDRADASDGASLFSIAPAGGWPLGVTGTLRVDAGLRGEAGPLPTLEAVQTELVTREGLRLLRWSCEGRNDRSCEDGPIVLHLTHELAGDEEPRIRVWPEPPGLEIRPGWSYDDDKPVVEIHGDFTPGRDYVVAMPASLTDEHGQRLGRRARVAVRMREALPEHARERSGPVSLQLSSTSGTFPRPEDARVGIVAEHVESVRVRVVVLDDAMRLAWLGAEELAEAPWPEGGSTVELQGLETRGREGRAEHVLDLARFAGQGDAVLVEVQAEDLTAHAQLSEPLAPVRGLFQLSGLGAVVELGPARGVARITRTADGEPWKGVELHLHTAKGERTLPTSDADGLVRLPGARTVVGRAWLRLDAPDGDRLVVPLAAQRWPAARGRLGWYLRDWHQPAAMSTPPAGLRRGERAIVAVEAGRGVFLPGETIHLAGWAAISTPHGELAMRRAEVGTPVVIELRHRGDQVASRRLRLDRNGRFWASLPLPEGASLGEYELHARMLESSTSVALGLADVRIPTFELEASMLHPQRVIGEPNRLRIDARNLSGEPTPVERMRWSMACMYTWPDLGSWDWRFGSAVDVPLTREGELEVVPTAAHAEVELPTAELAAGGAHHCSVSVAAQDVSLQEVGAETSFVVHPAPVYVGVRVPQQQSVAGEPFVVEVKAVDLKRRRVALEGSVEVRIERVVAEPGGLDERGKQTVESTLVERCRLELAADGDHARCGVRRPKAGYYEVLATAVHEGVALRTETGFTVAPAPRRERSSGSSHVDEDDAPKPPPSAKRPPDFRIVAPEELPTGRPAEILVEAPWPSASGVLTISQTGLRDAAPFVLRDGRATVTVTPRAGQGPLLELRATVTRPSEDGARARAHATSREVRLTEPRRLLVEIDAPTNGRPGQRVPVRLVVRDPESSEPIDARLAVWVIDDGVHQLRSASRSDLGSVFDPERPRLDTLTDAHEALLDPFSAWAWRRISRSPAVHAAAGMVKGSFESEVHDRFDPDPLFVGDVGTGPDGEAEVVLPLPHDLTRFRITAIASAELPGGGSGPVRFGRDEATLQVSAPLMIRLALPRVLRPGDEAELAALVTPPRGAEGTLAVELSLEDAEGQLVVQGFARKSQAIHGRRPLRVPFTVKAKGPGRPAVRVHAILTPTSERKPSLESTVERPLVVELERTAIERTAVYGRLDRDEPVAIPVRVPDGARADHGGLELSVRATAVGDLDEAAEYLEEYPYGCLEQTASRLLPQLALQGLADRLPPGADPSPLVLEGLARLRAMQHEDGTFGYWPDDPEPAGHAGAHATWVMQLAVDAGHSVPGDVLERALDAIAAGLSAPLPGAAQARDLRRAEQALEAHVLVHAGRGGDEAVRAVLDDLHAHRNALPLFARAWLLMALHGADPHDPRVAVVRRGISAAIEELPGSAHPVDTASERYAELFDSDARTHALVLLAWLRLDPADPLVDKLADGLRLRRSGGRWRNTQENAYALLALSAHAREREAVEPDHRIEAWVGPTALAPLELHGRDPALHERSVSMAELLGPLGTDRTATVVLDREGDGAAYWRLGMEWAATGPAPARSQGLSLSRRLLDAEGEPVDPSSLQAGRRYLLEVTVEADAPQPYVALELPLPAGLEAIDTTLGAGGRARTSTKAIDGDWIAHQELHRDRVLLFADELGAGRHVHAVPVLATTPGRYVLPAAMAEAMYSPEVRARTTVTRVNVGPS